MDTFTDVTSLTARYRLPAVYPYRQFTAVGGQLFYGHDLIDNFRRAPTYVDGELGRETERPFSPGPGQVRACDKPQDRHGAWPQRAFASSTARRRGDRVNCWISQLLCFNMHETLAGTELPY